jgi:hypothetical protein
MGTQNTLVFRGDYPTTARKWRITKRSPKTLGSKSSLPTPTALGSAVSTKTPTGCSVGFCPKSTGLSVYTQEQLDIIALHHNAKPRKYLDWKSPAELFLPEGSFNFQAYWSTIINPVALGT